VVSDRAPSDAARRPPARVDPWLPQGRALRDYLDGRRDATVRVRGPGDEIDDVRAETFFRDPSRMEPWELVALDECRGRVLDLGAGAGSHALELQRRGHAVTAVDPCPEAARVMTRRGVADVRRSILADVDDGPYDTVLLLMHGVGIAGDLPGLAWLLADLHRVAAPDGRVLLDSRAPPPESLEAPDVLDPGTAELRLEYGDLRGAPFPWLFLGEETLAAWAERVGWRCEVRHREADGRYLAGLVAADPR